MAHELTLKTVEVESVENIKENLITYINNKSIEESIASQIVSQTI